MNKWIKYRENLINVDSIKSIYTMNKDYEDCCVISIEFLDKTMLTWDYKSKEKRDDDFYAIEIFFKNIDHSFLELEEEDE